MTEMREVSVLVGGRASDGINSAGALVARLLGRLGYYVYLNFDYPSLIRGGHNFAVIRGGERPIGTYREKVDFILALNQETVTRHQGMMHAGTVIVSNADLVKSGGQGVPVKSILHELQAPEIMGNSAMIGGFAKAAGIGWETVEEVFRASLPKGTDQNLKVARAAYDMLTASRPVQPCSNPPSLSLPETKLSGSGLSGAGWTRTCRIP